MALPPKRKPVTGLQRKPAPPPRPQAKAAPPEETEELVEEANDQAESEEEAEPTPKAPGAICPKCGAEMARGIAYCGACGASMKTGMKRTYKPGDAIKRIAKRGRMGKINEGRNTLMWLAILNLGFGFLLYALMSNGLRGKESDALTELRLLIVLSCGLPGVIFIGLFFWARKNPLPAMISGLVVYLTFMILTIVVAPESLLSPLAMVIRIAIILALVNGIKGAHAERQAQARDARERRREKAEQA